MGGAMFNFFPSGYLTSRFLKLIADGMWMGSVTWGGFEDDAVARGEDDVVTGGGLEDDRVA